MDCNIPRAVKQFDVIMRSWSSALKKKKKGAVNGHKTANTYGKVDLSSLAELGTDYQVA